MEKTTVYIWAYIPARDSKKKIVIEIRKKTNSACKSVVSTPSSISSTMDQITQIDKSTRVFFLFCLFNIDPTMWRYINNKKIIILTPDSIQFNSISIINGFWQI